MKLAIRDGYVIDAKAEKKKDIFIEDGKIVGNEPEGDVQEINAEGCYVFPGLVDFHAHLFSTGSQTAVYPDSMIFSGITTAVDAGTSGCSSFSAYHQEMERSQCSIYSFLNVYTGGIFSGTFQENYDPALYDKERIKELKRRYPDEIKGLKIRIGRETVGELGLHALEKTVSLAETIGDLMVCVHTTNSLFHSEEIVKILRKGDIFCHVYNGGENQILDSKGNVYKGIRDAREKGVIFDAAHGRWNFSHHVARCAIEQGFLPDIISSDVTSQRYRFGKHAKSLPFVMSKYLALGMSLPEIIERTTLNPLKLLGVEEKGVLKTGKIADISIFKKKSKEIIFQDSDMNILKGHEILVPQMTIRRGEILYCQEDFFL